MFFGAKGDLSSYRPWRADSGPIVGRAGSRPYAHGAAMATGVMSLSR